MFILIDPSQSDCSHLRRKVGGPSSDRGETPPHRRNPRVSAGLSDIVRKCLRPDPRGTRLERTALAQHPRPRDKAQRAGYSLLAGIAPGERQHIAIQLERGRLG